MVSKLTITTVTIVINFIGCLNSLIKRQIYVVAKIQSLLAKPLAVLLWYFHYQMLISQTIKVRKQEDFRAIMGVYFTSIVCNQKSFTIMEFNSFLDS